MIHKGCNPEMFGKISNREGCPKPLSQFFYIDGEITKLKSCDFDDRTNWRGTDLRD